MKIKHKLRLGFGLLFLAVAFFGFLSLFFLKRMSEGSEIILKDNYASLKYADEMRGLLETDKVPLSPAAIQAFSKALIKEENNITEPGEKEAVADLRNAFEKLRSTSAPLEVQKDAENVAYASLRKIVELNLNAVESKSNRAENSVENATVYIGFLAAFTFLILFSLIFNLVGFFEEPFKQLTEGLRNIANKKPANKLRYDKDEELGDLYGAYNEVLVNSDKSQREWEEKAMAEKLKAEVVSRHADSPIIILNSNKEITDINAAAEQVLNMGHKVLGSKTEKAENESLLYEITTNKKNGETISINDVIYQVQKESIIIPSTHISSLQEGELTEAGRMEGEVIILKRRA